MAGQWQRHACHEQDPGLSHCHQNANNKCKNTTVQFYSVNAETHLQVYNLTHRCTHMHTIEKKIDLIS